MLTDGPEQQFKNENGGSSPGLEKDPLLEALKFIARGFGNYVTDAVVLTGLPVTDRKIPVTLIDRAALNCGLSSAVVRKDLVDVPNSALPAIVVMDSSRILILTQIDKQKKVLQLVDPLAPERKIRQELNEFIGGYSGLAIFFKTTSVGSGESENSISDDGHWFWGTISIYWRDYVHVIIAALLINMLALASPLFTMNVYDRVVPNFAIPTLWALAIGVILSLIFDFVLKIARNQIINVAGKQADQALASKIFAHALAIDLEKRPVSSGQFANHVKEFETVREFFTSSSLVSIIDMFFIGIFLAVLYLIVGSIALIPLIAIPIVVAINLLVQIPLASSIERSHKESALRHSVMVESIANLDTIRALNAEAGMQTKWERSVAASGTAILSGRYWAVLAQSATGFIQASLNIAIIIWGVYLISDGEITMGGLIAAMMLSGRAMAPLASVASTLTRLRQTLHSFRTLDALMAIETERKPGRNYVNRQISGGTIEFKAVDFRYPDASDDSLNGVSFRVSEGETVGIIGRVGAGKTTVGRLIAGLYYPSNGVVLVDGIDTRQFDPADLRTGVGFVSQDNVLFSGSVRDNICVGQTHADDEAVIEAARIAGVDEFVIRHPMGFDMPVGEAGRLLSGGQRQAVALARTLLRRPKILFLDEPSSNLDLTSERRLITRLNEYNNSGTTVIISTHRMSLVELTNRLLTFENGKLALDGPREEVLNQLQQLGAAKAAEGRPEKS